MKDKDIHAYYNEEGKRIPSVTQVVSLLAKQGISEWANMLGFYHKNYDKVLKEYAENGILYCDNNGDVTFPLKISITTNDHDINYIMLKKNDVFIGMLRYYFEHGCFRFKDLKCKECIMKMLSY